jgi:hypothetical protein
MELSNGFFVIACAIVLVGIVLGRADISILAFMFALGLTVLNNDEE